MKYYAMTDAPMAIYGLDVIDPENHIYARLPEEDRAGLNETAAKLAGDSCGGRLRFRTNAKQISVKLRLHSNRVDCLIPLTGSAGVDVYVGTGLRARFCGQVSPKNYTELEKEKKISLQHYAAEAETVSVTICFPRNEPVAGLEIGFPDTAEVLPPEPFTCPERICFYGSSITAGGCASRPGNAYTATVARWLDCDYQNLGFSGSALGELAAAELIARRNFTMFVMDYDHNAPNAEHLQDTHEAFYQCIRQAHPDMPILMMTKPDFRMDSLYNNQRRDVIFRNYMRAREVGDRHIYFLDGESFFAGPARENCLVDGLHPNDLGFYLMAEKVYDRILDILEAGKRKEYHDERRTY